MALSTADLNQLKEFYAIEDLVYELDIEALQAMELSIDGQAIRDSFLKDIEDAPSHNGDKCLTHVFYGNCPPWPHG